MQRKIKNKSIHKSNDIKDKNMQGKEKYQSLINNLTDIILESNSKAIVSYVSPQCYDNLGYKPAEIIGTSAFDYIHPDDTLKIAEALKKGIDTGEIISVPKYRLLHKDGNIIFVSARGKFIGSVENGKFIVAIRDISIRVEMEKKLKESEEKYKHLFQNSPYGIILLNFNGEIIDVNLTFEKIFGYLKEDFVGTDFFKIPALPPEILPLLKKRFELYKQRKVLDPIELQVFKSDGSIVWVNPQVSLITLTDETFIQIIVQDITEKKHAESLILEENRKLLELNQTKSELITKTSHELKNPLNSIYATSQYLLTNLKEQIGEEAFKFVEMIHRGGQKLKLLIENLLDLSKVESVKFSLHLQEEDIVELTFNCIKDVEYWADKRKINISIDHPKELRILVDRLKIEQVLTNLLSNAIKYTPPKGKIHVKINENDEEVRISISDNGIGLTKKEIKGLFKKYGKFERFINGADIESEGTGLGLFISKEIVELHNGEILVKSKGRNQGATFIIILPPS